MTYRQPVTVMYVDETESERRTTHQRIANLGFMTLSSSGGAEALAAIQENSESMALVMIGWGMKQMPGSYLARAIAVQWPRIPVLFLAEMSVAQLRATLKGGRDQETFTEENVMMIPCADRDLQSKIHAILTRGPR
jgi:CheY-like chemotaxis protein